MSEIKTSERLLNTKLMPPRLTSAVVPREELLARLDAGLTKKVILLTAPTGFGKTTLIRLWLDERMKEKGGRLKGLPPFRFAWVTLDEHDNDPVRFWTYVCSALRTIDPSLGKA